MFKVISIRSSKRTDYFTQSSDILKGLTLFLDLVDFFEKHVPFLIPSKFMKQSTLTQLKTTVTTNQFKLANIRKNTDSISTLQSSGDSLLTDLIPVKNDISNSLSELQNIIHNILRDENAYKKELQLLLTISKTLLASGKLKLTDDNKFKRYKNYLEKETTKIKQFLSDQKETNDYLKDQQFKNCLFPFCKQLTLSTPLLNECIKLEESIFRGISNATHYVSAPDETKSHYYYWYKQVNPSKMEKILLEYKSYLLEKKQEINDKTSEVTEKMGNHTQLYSRLMKESKLETEWITTLKDYDSKQCPTQETSLPNDTLWERYYVTTTGKHNNYIRTLHTTSQLSILNQSLKELNAQKELTSDQIVLDLKNTLTQTKGEISELESKLTKTESLKSKSFALLNVALHQNNYYALGNYLFHHAKKEIPDIETIISEKTCAMTTFILGNGIQGLYSPTHLALDTTRSLFFKNITTLMPVFKTLDSALSRFDKLGVLEKQNTLALALGVAVFQYLNKRQSLAFNLGLYFMSHAINKGIDRTVDELFHRTSYSSSIKNITKTLMLFLIAPYSLKYCFLLKHLLFPDGPQSQNSANTPEFQSCDDAHYVLKTNKDMTSTQLRKAYRTIALENHPDKGGKSEIMTNINNANDYVKDKLNGCMS